MQAGEPLENAPAGPTESPGFLADGTWEITPVRYERVDLPGGVLAPQCSRRAIEQYFTGAVGEERLASLELLTTELVSNAVRHGGADEGETVVLHLAIAPRRLRVEVCDRGRGFEAERPTPYGEGGYGLFIVSEVSNRWGVSREDGTCAWFELDTPEGTG